MFEGIAGMYACAVGQRAQARVQRPTIHVDGMASRLPRKTVRNATAGHATPAGVWGPRELGKKKAGGCGIRHLRKESRSQHAGGQARRVPARDSVSSEKETLIVEETENQVVMLL